MLNILLGYMKKYIIEYVGGTKGDMVCIFLNNAPPNQDGTGKTSPLEVGCPNWLKLMIPTELTLDRFEEVLATNPHTYLPSHPLWAVYNPKYLDLIEKYNYEICSLKFDKKHYVTIRIESILKNTFKQKDGDISILNEGSRSLDQLVDLLNMLFFEERKVPDWFKDANPKYDFSKFKDIFTEKRTDRTLGLLKAIPTELYRQRARYNRLFNEMTEHRTLLSYEELFCSDLPYPLNPDRKEEWLNLVENSWCNYDKGGYRDFTVPENFYEYGKVPFYLKPIMEILEQWKK